MLKDLIFCTGPEVGGPGVARPRLRAPELKTGSLALLGLLAVATAISASTAANPIYVDASATGANNGSTWADAYNSLQDALTAADMRNADADPNNDVSQIRVAAGTYMPDGGYKPVGGPHVPGTGDRTATFQLINGVALRGGYAGVGAPDPNLRDIALYETILSGDLNGDDTRVLCTVDSPDCDSFGRLCADDGFCVIWDNNDENSFHVVTGSGTDASAIVDGFTITGGNADSSLSDPWGGGMYTFNGSPMVDACVFVGNGAGVVNAGGGGGMYNTFESSPTVMHCVFTQNYGSIGGGGMLNNSSSNPVVLNSTFRENSAGAAGGGMRNQGSNPTVMHSAFRGNSAGVGGGVSNLVSSSPAIHNCIFNSNHGGGIYNFNDSNPTVGNCTFVANSGSAMYNDFASSPIVTNTIFWGESPNNIFNQNPSIDTPTVRYSNVHGGLSPGTVDGGGNIDAHPLFVDAAGPDGTPGTEDDDLRLQACSPAIDAGDNTAVPSDTLDLDDDGNTTEPIPYDLDGKSRFFDDGGSTDTGVGTPPIVDMGAHEFQATSMCAGIADLDCDCDVDLRDFARLQDCFGAIDPLGCNPIAPPDLDDNGQVDLDDYALFVAEVTGPGP